MKNKNKFFELGKRLLVDGSVGILVAVLIQPLVHSSHDQVFAEELGVDVLSDAPSSVHPYAQTFTISAYYSPLPCQNRYTTGSYDGDIRLNGRGVRGADGTGVYPGMVAAPRTFDFGTKMDIPGVGIVAVHDRGGAIKAANGQPGVYDRLDIWMGYGDKGLTRALNWGKRTVDVVVYGHNDAIVEQIILSDYSSEEAEASCHTASDSEVAEILPPAVEPEVIEPPVVEEVVAQPEAVEAEEEAPELVAQSIPVLTIKSPLDKDLKLGDFGSDVENLQIELRNLNYYRGDVTGYFGPVTEHAVYKFQQAQSLVGDKLSTGAGSFGPKTRDRMNEIVVTRMYNTQLVAVATNNYNSGVLARRKGIIIASELGFGMTGPEVAKLQKFLKDKGYFDGTLLTEYFGPVTQTAVIKFQKDNKIITTETDPKAGIVTSDTLELINILS